MRENLPLGKLEFGLLETLLKRYYGETDPRVVTGPRVGEDAAVIDFPDRYLVAKTDPVTFATDEIGWYAVQVNANDIATRGATPMWFQASILLPDKKTTEELVENIFAQISRACRELGVTVVGGHTEISYNLDRPIVAGCMLGEVAKEKLVTTSGARPGDVILLTKGIVIEGTSIIAREKHDDLTERGCTEAFIRKCRDFLYTPGLSVVRDALLANRFEVHAMHDPTEGGLASGLYEIAAASHTGLVIERNAIPVLEESEVVCREYGLDPLGTITSGSLLIAAPVHAYGDIVSLLHDNGIRAVVIGEVRERGYGIKIADSAGIADLKYSATDEITKIFE